MFDDEIKHLYKDLERKLKVNSEASFKNVNEEI